jgi:hypothetical protein
MAYGVALRATVLDRCWLQYDLVIDDEASAKDWTERGLAIEEDNVHCLSLAQRLGIRPLRLPPPTARGAKTRG